MRLFTFEIGGARKIGAELKGQMIDLPVAYAAFVERRGTLAAGLRAMPGEMLTFIRLGASALEPARQTVEFMKKRPAAPVGEQLAYPMELVRILAPISRPGKIIIASGDSKGISPGKFAGKFSSAIVGPHEAIALPSGTSSLNARPCLAAIVGAPVRKISTESALTSVFGYTVLNDLSSNELAGEPMLARNCDGFAPLGPCIVTSDEAEGQTSDELLDRLAEALYSLSQTMTLGPGDIVAVPNDSETVVPAGHIVRAEIAPVGLLENPLRAQVLT